MQETLNGKLVDSIPDGFLIGRVRTDNSVVSGVVIRIRHLATVIYSINGFAASPLQKLLPENQQQTPLLPEFSQDRHMKLITIEKLIKTNGTGNSSCYRCHDREVTSTT
jgi:hypothetical protein